MLLDETLLSDVQVTVGWTARRAWRRGAVIRDWYKGGQPLGLYLVRDGIIEVEMAGEVLRAHNGQIVLVSAARRDRIEALADTDWLTLGITPSLHGRVDLATLLNPPAVWTPAANVFDFVVLCLETMNDGWVDTHSGDSENLIVDRKPRTPAARLVTEGLSKAIFGLCWQDMRPLSTVSVDALEAPDWVIDALQRMRRTPALSIAELCRDLKVSPAHLRRMFHRYVGKSPKEQIMDCRLEMARQLLETSAKPVGVIGLEIGFDSASHFTQTFTRRFNTAPAQYRETFRLPRLQTLP